MSQGQDTVNNKSEPNKIYEHLPTPFWSTDHSILGKCSINDYITYYCPLSSLKEWECLSSATVCHEYLTFSLIFTRVTAKSLPGVREEISNLDRIFQQCWNLLPLLQLLESLLVVW